MKYTKTKQQSGFTLIELLVVVAIIGMLLSVISVVFVDSRMKSRDAKRVSDMRQITTGLEIFYGLGSNGYPDATVWNAAATSGSSLTCGGTVTLSKIPGDPSIYDYTYVVGGLSHEGCGGTVWDDYYVRFYLERDSEFGPGGEYYYQTEKGVVNTAPF